MKVVGEGGGRRPITRGEERRGREEKAAEGPEEEGPIFLAFASPGGEGSFAMGFRENDKLGMFSLLPKPNMEMLGGVAGPLIGIPDNPIPPCCIGKVDVGAATSAAARLRRRWFDPWLACDGGGGGGACDHGVGLAPWLSTVAPGVATIVLPCPLHPAPEEGDPPADGAPDHAWGEEEDAPPGVAPPDVPCPDQVGAPDPPDPAAVSPGDPADP